MSRKVVDETLNNSSRITFNMFIWTKPIQIYGQSIIMFLSKKVVFIWIIEFFPYFLKIYVTIYKYSQNIFYFSITHNVQQISRVIQVISSWIELINNNMFSKDITPFPLMQWYIVLEVVYCVS